MEYKNKILNFNYPNVPIQIGNLIHYGKFNSATHTAFALKEEGEFVWVVEAANQGIVKTKYEKWWLDLQYEKGKLAIGTPIYPLDEKKVESFIKKTEGQPYAWMKLKDMAVYWFLGRTDVEDTDTAWICSEHTCELLKVGNPKLDIVKELNLPQNDYCSPMDLQISKLISWEDKSNGVYI
jgi:hypothetical protein